MRTRKEILEDFINARDDIHSPNNSNLRPILEVLFDIRDLLKENNDILLAIKIIVLIESQKF